MVKCECVQKNRDNNGKIVSYVIVDKTGKGLQLTSDRLKEMIFCGQLDVINLTLTSDGRLVDKKTKIDEEPVKVTKLDTKEEKPNTESELDRLVYTLYKELSLPIMYEEQVMDVVRTIRQILKLNNPNITAKLHTISNNLYELTYKKYRILINATERLIKVHIGSDTISFRSSIEDIKQYFKIMLDCSIDFDLIDMVQVTLLNTLVKLGYSNTYMTHNSKYSIVNMRPLTQIVILPLTPSLQYQTESIRLVLQHDLIGVIKTLDIETKLDLDSIPAFCKQL